MTSKTNGNWAFKWRFSQSKIWNFTL